MNSVRNATPAVTGPDLVRLSADIKEWGRELGFERVGIADTNLAAAEVRLSDWLRRERHGEMTYMAAHGTRRSRPDDLIPGTVRVISARMNYLPRTGRPSTEVLNDRTRAFVSRYALGRDYHKMMRRRLQRLADRIQAAVGGTRYRVFTDSAPVLEKALAEKAGLGWIGKHTNLISPESGSWFFLGEIYTDLPLPLDASSANHCGTCRSCIDACPTGAIVAPYELDARRCISYLTIELRGRIPLELRPLVGNRIFGCDDCQMVCPWNRFAQPSDETDFLPRHGLDARDLIELFSWTEAEFLQRTEGSAIRRIGFECWLRNIAVALGNAPTTPAVLSALRARRDDDSAMVREHVQWALARHSSGSDDSGNQSVH